MCGRFTITLTKEDFLNYLMRYEDLEISIQENTLPQYNVAPSEEIIAMIKHDSKYRVGTIKWGFMPHFTVNTSKSTLIINARAETLLTKNLFKESVTSKRCIIFADSFYEWKSINGQKTPYRIMLKNKKLFAFAGIWSINKSSDKPLYSAAIITTQSNKLMESIHDRMPVILSDNDIVCWLDPTSTKEKYMALLKPYSAEEMFAYEISSYVNNASHKDQKCILKQENT